MFLLGTTIALICVGLLLARTNREPTTLQRVIVVASGLLLVGALALAIPDVGAPSVQPSGVLLVLGLPVTACLWFAQSLLARQRPWSLLIVIPVLWVAGLFIGLILAVNLGIAQP
jgi:hypothetical protein